MLIHLLTSLAYANEGAPDFSLVGMWFSAGPIAKAVIVSLFIMALVSVLISSERFLAFYKARQQSMQLAQKVVAPLESGDLDAALVIAKDEAFKSAYLSAVLIAGLKELSERTDSHGLSAAKRLITKSINQEMTKTRRGMAILATVGSTAPFVGLFGTTFGIITAFQKMAGGGGGLSEISVGIAEALTTTAGGIFVAVIGVWMFNYFNSRAEGVAGELEGAEADFIDWAEKLLLKRAESGANQ